MGRQTTLEERQLVIFHHKKNKSQREIAKILNRSASTIQHIIERYNRENRVKNKRKISPKKKFNEHDERWIVRQSRNNPLLSAPKLTLEVQRVLGKTVNAETVRRTLRRADLHGRIARKKPFISEKNRRSRLKFALEHQNKDFNFWKSVLFSDESKFNLFGSDGKVNVWRKKNEELKPQHLKPTVKHGGGHVMVWGCVSAAGVGNLHFIEGNMDRFMYLNILKQNLVASARKLEIADDFRFYQDNDPKHSSRVVQEWLLYNCRSTLKTPAQSPDINIIENLWHYLEIKVRSHRISNRNDLKNALLEEWNNISSDYTRKLVESVPNRLQLVIKSKGNPTKY